MVRWMFPVAGATTLVIACLALWLTGVSPHWAPAGVALVLLAALLLWRSARWISALAAERARADEASRWQAGLFELSHDAIFVWSPDRGIESWNRGAEDLYGYSAEEATGRVSHQLLHTSFPCPWPEIEVQLVRMERWEGELKHRTKAGAEVIVSARWQIVRGSDGRRRVLETNRDLSGVRRADAALRESEQRYRAIFENVALGIGETDLQQRFVDVNDRFCATLGYRRDELLGMTVTDLTVPEDRELTRELNARLRDGSHGTFEYEKRYRQRDGTPLWVHVTVSAIRDHTGRLLRRVGTVEDISDRKRAEDRLLQSEVRFRSLTMASSEVLYRMSPDWSEMRQLNSQLFLTDTEEPSRSWLQAYIPEDEQARVCAAIDQAVRTQSIFELEHRVRRKDGSLGWTFSRAVPMKNDRGEIIEWFGAASDITERKLAEERVHHLNESLERRNAELEEASRRKDEFLAMLSHELRNPLAPIRNSLFILDRAAPEGEQALRARATIERQVTHLTRIVGDLLDVSRITRGKIELRCERLDLGELVARTVEDHRSLFATGQIGLTIEQTEATPWVHGDAARLTQILGNVLQNAAKFTPAGGHVTVALRREGSSALLAVRDTGVGIAPEMMARLFEPFSQADCSLDRSAGGLGLGLAVTKGLVKMHGGEIHAASGGPGRGAEFTIRLPAEAAPPSEPVPSPRQLRVAGPRPRRVLVIEDNCDAAETLKESLELDGHEVSVAHDGNEGLAQARAFSPDVVLCDIGLPGIDGYEVARALRHDQGLRNASLMALTGYAAPEDRERAIAAGFDLHMAKPPDIDVIERWLADMPVRAPS